MLGTVAEGRWLVDVFGVRDQVVAEYAAYVESFLRIGDPTSMPSSSAS